jgi:hypothetical protein
MVYTITSKDSEASGKFATSNLNETGPGPSNININPLKVYEERDEERIELIKIYYYIFSLQKTVFWSFCAEHGRPKVTAALKRSQVTE